MDIETSGNKVTITFRDEIGDSQIKLRAVADVSKGVNLGKLRALHEMTRQLDALVASARSAISDEHRSIIELDELGN